MGPDYSYNCSEMYCLLNILRRIFLLIYIYVYYTPRFNEVDRGVYWYHLVRLSVCLFVCLSVGLSICGQNRVRSVSSTILIWSISYLHIFEILVNFLNLLFWLGIQYDSMEWVIMRRRGVSSERRHSSCSSFFCFMLNTSIAITITASIYKYIQHPCHQYH